MNMHRLSPDNDTGCEVSSLDPGHALPATALQRLARMWLREDAPQMDWAGAVVGEQTVGARVLLKSTGVLAGLPFVQAIFTELGLCWHWLWPEGGEPRPPCEVGRVWGPARSLLLAERAALNTLAHAGGVATACWRARLLAEARGWPGVLAGTRKTTPGLRLVEKHAMLVGGVSGHRFDLGDLLMLKDNHLAVVGNIAKAVRDARTMAGVFRKVEVEARSLDQARQAAAAGADIVMLDNFTPQELLEAARGLREEFPALLIEASGGITEENLPNYLLPCVDIVSMGAFTQSITALDFSMKVDPELGGIPECLAGDTDPIRRQSTF
ncbi:nicotinate-nucleotide pyrophosphorylase [carboxylating]-like isoform X1 [Narcine bancroftii]|uniref:nicotinate-nucleotide pyrophosphorylase [carboxylating]-like isoform X1 n=1 Tax=Narcine bancroftii TaxID=1343680 RepID=UPI003831DF28